MAIIDLFKILFSNPLMGIGVIGVIAIIFIIVYLKISSSPSTQVLYFDESTRSGIELNVIRETPISIRCMDNYRFYNYQGGYTFDVGRKSIKRYMGKRGTAYVYKPVESLNPDQTTVTKIGTLYDGLVNLWGEDAVLNLKDDYLKALEKSDFFITVDLEKGLTPKDLPILTEQDITDDANRSMLELIGLGISSEMKAEDWVKIIALIGAGVGLSYILQGLGIFG